MTDDDKLTYEELEQGCYNQQHQIRILRAGLGRAAKLLDDGASLQYIKGCLQGTIAMAAQHTVRIPDVEGE